MQAREEFHKVARGHLRGLLGWALFAAPIFAGLGCAPGDGAAREERSTLVAEAATPPVAGPPAGHAWIVFGADTVLAEVAATSDERADGLMYREEVPDGTGMLFVFPDVEVRSFWMANTYVPLDIAFMDASFAIVDIAQMEPLVTESYTSRAPAMYGLEVRQGWLGEKGIAVGARAQVVFGVSGR